MKALSLALLFGATLAVVAAPASAVDLLSVYKDAQGNDAVFSGARFTLEAGREAVPQGYAGLLPTVSASANTVRNDVDVSSRVPSAAFVPGSRVFNTNNLTFSLTQPLFRWSNWQTYEQAKLSVMQAEAQYAQAGQDLAVRVVQAYFDVLAAQDTLTVARAKKAAISEQLAQAKRNFEVGTSTIVDTNEAQSRYDLVIAEELAAQNDIAVKRTALQQIIGKAPGDLAPLRPEVAIPPPQPAQIEKWVEAAEAGNYAVKAQEAAAEVARRGVEIQRAGHYPTLDLTAARTQNSSSGSATNNVGSDTTSYTLGLQLAVPIYAGGAVNSRVRQAIANQEKARADLENQKRTAAQNARQFFLSVTNGLAQVRALEAALTSSKTSLDSNRLGYEVGVRINIDVLNAQQQLYTTQRDLSKARYDTIVNGFRLKAATGGLTEEDVAAVNGLLAR
ncbi:MAG: TolC family outer membrane protein [Burkholderiales bacterium]|nr:TolC family outer membrane protein [Burkholderiales bacterium]